MRRKSSAQPAGHKARVRIAAVTSPLGRRAILGRPDAWGTTLAYGVAHLGKSLFWYSSEILFAFFLTEIAGLSTNQMGLVLASGFGISAAIDLAVGHGLRNRLADPVSAGRMQLIGAILCSAASLAVFLGASIPPELRFGYAIAAGIAFRFAFAAYDIPQNALMALATAHPEDRLRLASTRIWFSGTATLIVAGSVGPMVALHAGPGSARFLVGLSLSFAVVAVASAWLMTQLLRGAAASPPAGTPRRPVSGPPAKAFLWLLLVMVATSAFTPAFAKLEPYFAAYALRSAWWGGLVIALVAGGILLGQPLWLRLCRTRPHGSVMLWSALLQIGALTIFGIVGSASPPVAAAAAFLFGLGNGGVGMVQWAAFSETVAAAAPTRAGPSYGMFAAGAKIGFAGGGVLLAAALSRTDFRGAGSGDLATLMAIVPMVGAALVCLAAIQLRTGSEPAARGGARD